MKIHICPLDRDCRSIGAPPRLHLNGENWTVTISVWRGGSTQAWYPWSGNTFKWRAIAIHPRHELKCMEQIEVDGRPVACSRLKRHRGHHRSLRWRGSSSFMVKW